MSVFKSKRPLWVADKEQLAEELYNKATQDKSSCQIKEELYWILDSYNVSRSPREAKGNALWRLSTPIFYLVGILSVILLQPILYIFNKSIENTKLGYTMRAWESKL